MTDSSGLTVARDPVEELLDRLDARGGKNGTLKPGDLRDQEGVKTGIAISDAAAELTEAVADAVIRVVGVVGAAGGVSEAALGVSCALAVTNPLAAIGCGLVILHGIDGAQAGVRTATSGNPTPTVTSTAIAGGLEAAGVGAQTAGLVAGLVDMGLSIGGSIAAGLAVGTASARPPSRPAPNTRPRTTSEPSPPPKPPVRPPAGVPSNNAAAAALAEANAAQAQGLRGAAAGLETSGGTFTGRSTGAGGGPLCPDVQAAYDAVPPGVPRPGYHGKCAEGRAISAAIQAGADPKGGTIVVTTVGGPGHGTPKPPCASCQWVLDFFGIKSGVK